MLISKIQAILIGLTLLTPLLAVVCPTGSSVIPNCLTCTTSNNNIVCSSCISGYYLVSTACASCSSVLSNCAACGLSLASQPTCYICQANYGLLNGICQNCSAITGCASCQIISYNLQCTACSANLVLYSAQMQCIPCVISNCNNCSVSNAGTFTCTSCINGYYLSSNICNSCALNISNCASCLYDQNGKLICSACASLYFYLFNNTCSANCTKGGYGNCKTCQIVSITANTMICTTCIPNFYLDMGTNNCLSCNQALTGCTNCSMTSTTTENSTVNFVTCSACASNYFLSSNPSSCVVCNTVKPNCQTCNFDFSTQSGTCTSCSSGYYLNSTDLTCYSCSSSPYIVTTTFASGSCSKCTIDGTNAICATCMPNFYLISGKCKTCGDLMTNCSTCNYNTTFTCLSCNSGSILNAVGQCSLCSTIYTNCNYCNNVECTDCMPGYYTLNNKICLINCAVSNCKQCASKNNTKCSTCNTGYSLTSQFTCKMIGCTPPLIFNGVECICPYQNYYVQAGNICQPCSDKYCLICANNQCSQCLDGFFLLNNACNKCLPNCQYCNNASTCLLCTNGFIYSNGKCQSFNSMVHGGIGVTLNANFYQLCSRGCNDCTPTACLSCEQGYFLNGTICTFCPKNCKLCKLNTTITSITNQSTNQTTDVETSSITCMICQSGLALINQVCSSCNDVNCVKCDYNIYFCILCSITYTADANGLCKSCSSNCNFCDINGAGTCDEGSCFIGYANFNLTTCIRCLNGCSSCIGTYPFTCIGCLVGSYIANASDSSSACLNCDYGCDECTGPKACISCFPNFNLANGICTPLCVLPCVSCTLLANKTQICSTCLQGYSLSNGTCIADFSCMSTKICEFCPLGNFAYQGSCSNCPSNCAQCTFNPDDPAFIISGNNYISFLNCTQCSNGFYLDVSMVCQKCPTNCSFCISSNQCTACSPSYFLEYKLLNGVNDLNYSVGICQPCSPECFECQVEPNRCVSCKSNFYLSNFICKSFTNVSFTYVLTSSSNNTNGNDTGMFMSIVNNIPQLFLQIANSLGTLFAQNQHLIMINSITNGSVIISGAANIDSNTNDPSTVYNSLSLSVQQINTINNYKVASYSIAANGFTPTTPAPSTTTTATSSDYLIYIIIGSAIVAIAAIIIIICICLKRRKKQRMEETQVETTEKVQTQQQQQPATSKNMLKSEELYAKSSAGVQDEFSQRPKTNRTSKRPLESQPLPSVNPKLQQVSHISGNKTVVQHQNQQRKSIRAIPTIYEDKNSEEISQNKSKGHSKSKPKSSKNIPESIPHEQSQKYQSAKTIQIPTKDLQQKSKIEQKQNYRQIEQLRNDTNLVDEERTQKYVTPTNRIDSRKKSNSISKKYIPNSNSHYI